MLSSVSSYSNVSSAYAAQSDLSSMPKTASDLKAKMAKNVQTQDVYERADGTQVTAKDTNKTIETETNASTKKPLSQEESQFRDLMHQFVGQVLFGQMLKSMRATQEKNPYFHGGRAEEIFQGQLDMVLTDEMTKATSQTLSEPMFRQMQLMKK